MHQYLSKQAGVRVTDFDDLVKKMKDVQNQGKVFRTHSDPEALARHIMYEKGGSGSIVLDATNGLLNKVTGKARVGDIIKSKISNLQRKLSDADIRAGNKIQRTLEKHKATERASKAFSYNHDIPLAKKTDGSADELVRISVPALSAPIEKTKNVLLPTAGAIYLNSKIVDAAQQNNQNQGGDVVKESGYRQVLIEKIAQTLNGNIEEATSITPDNNSADETGFLLKRASTALKSAAITQKEMASDLVKLAEENKKMKTELDMIKRAEEARTVVDMMVNKSLIKKADVQSKVDELIEMDKVAFNMFKEAIGNVQPEEKVASGIEDLTFIMGSNIIEHRKTLADSLDDV
jgi:hypothetical protein